MPHSWPDVFAALCFAIGAAAILTAITEATYRARRKENSEAAYRRVLEGGRTWRD
jgi:hypothetical protein